MLPSPSILLFPTTLLLLLLLQIKCSLDASTSKTNWNLSWETFPATLVVAHTVADIVACVSNPDECPTPVLAVATMHSVTSCIVNDGGSLVDMSHMNNITQYDETTGIVTCQAGVTLSSLHAWLQDHYQREISFAPEMGDASVGSLVVTTSKDSSVNGPGYFSALVRALTYVDHHGEIIHLERERDGSVMEDFLCSFGMMGIVVEVQIETREAQEILTRVYARRRLSGADEAYEIIREAREKADNIFVNLSPQDGVLVIEERYQNIGERKIRSQVLDVFSPIWIYLIQRAKFYTIQHGHSFSDASFRPVLSNLGILDTFGKQFMYFLKVDIVHYRCAFTNTYDAVSMDEGRLDFTFHVYDMYEGEDPNKLEFIFKDTYNFVLDYYQETGYAPKGLNIYFVNRTGTKPYGEFRGPPGISFAMDPYESNPNSAEWKTFLEALNARQIQHDVRLSPTQTRYLASSDFQLSRNLTHQRFLTPHFAKFVTDS